MKTTQPEAQIVSRLFYSYEVVPVMRSVKWNIERGLTGEGKIKKSLFNEDFVLENERNIQKI